MSLLPGPTTAGRLVLLALTAVVLSAGAPPERPESHSEADKKLCEALLEAREVRQLCPLPGRVKARLRVYSDDQIDAPEAAGSPVDPQSGWKGLVCQARFSKAWPGGPSMSLGVSHLGSAKRAAEVIAYRHEEPRLPTTWTSLSGIGQRARRIDRLNKVSLRHTVQIQQGPYLIHLHTTDQSRMQVKTPPLCTPEQLVGVAHLVARRLP